MCILEVPVLSHTLAEMVERIGDVLVIVRKNLLPQGKGFFFQCFRLVPFPVAACGPGIS